MTRQPARAISFSTTAAAVDPPPRHHRDRQCRNHRIREFAASPTSESVPGAEDCSQDQYRAWTLV
jgi:hypothetical protein